jgi:hypothetical protein
LPAQPDLAGHAGLRRDRGSPVAYSPLLTGLYTARHDAGARWATRPTSSDFGPPAGRGGARRRPTRVVLAWLWLRSAVSRADHRRQQSRATDGNWRREPSSTVRSWLDLMLPVASGIPLFGQPLTRQEGDQRSEHWAEAASVRSVGWAAGPSAAGGMTGQAGWGEWTTPIARNPRRPGARRRLLRHRGQLRRRPGERVSPLCGPPARRSSPQGWPKVDEAAKSVGFPAQPRPTATSRPSARDLEKSLAPADRPHRRLLTTTGGFDDRAGGARSSRLWQEARSDHGWSTDRLTPSRLLVRPGCRVLGRS